VVSIDSIEARAREMLRSKELDKMEVYYLVETLFTELGEAIGSKQSKEAAKRGAWNVELLDDAVDSIVDALGGSYAVLDLWESAWELRVGNGDAAATLEKLINVIDLVRRKRIGKGARPRNSRRR